MTVKDEERHADHHGVHSYGIEGERPTEEGFPLGEGAQGLRNSGQGHPEASPQASVVKPSQENDNGEEQVRQSRSGEVGSSQGSLQAQAQEAVGSSNERTKARVLKLAVGLPAYGLTLDVGHASMWLSLGHALAVNNEHFELVAFGEVSINPVADARNKLVEIALATEADWLLQVDSDTFHVGQDMGGGTDILQMIKDGERRGAALIGAAVLGRKPNGQASGRMIMHDVPGLIEGSTKPEHMPEDLYRGQVVPCARLGGAFWAINLNFIRTMPFTGGKDKGPWFRHANVGGVITGEDYYFCDTLRANGGKIFVDGRFMPKHVMCAARL